MRQVRVNPEMKIYRNIQPDTPPKALATLIGACLEEAEFAEAKQADARSSSSKSRWKRKAKDLRHDLGLLREYLADQS